MIDWQPFSTVPRIDGTEILATYLCGVYRSYVVLEWDGNGNGWWCNSESFYRNEASKFTHWAKLNPPEESHGT